MCFSKEPTTTFEVTTDPVGRAKGITYIPSVDAVEEFKGKNQRSPASTGIPAGYVMKTPPLSPAQIRFLGHAWEFLQRRQTGRK